MALPRAYVNRSNTTGQYCSNCKHYINNYCIAFKEQVAPGGWCKVWESIEIRSIKS